MRMQHLFEMKWLGYLIKQLEAAIHFAQAMWILCMRCIDDIFCFTWIHQITRHKRLVALEKILRSNGATDLQHRTLTERWSEADFAVRFGRSAPRDLMYLVRAAARAGTPEEDLRILVINRDIFLKKGTLSIRSSWAIQVISWFAHAVFSSQVLLLCALTIAMSNPVSVKLFVLVATLSIYGFFWRGMSMYTTRPLAVGRRLKDELFLGARLPTSVTHPLEPARLDHKRETNHFSEQ